MEVVQFTRITGDNQNLQQTPEWAGVKLSARICGLCRTKFMPRARPCQLVMSLSHKECLLWLCYYEPLQVIDVSAGVRLAELAPAAVPPLLAEGFDHQNVEACPDYLPKLKDFLAHVESVSLHKQGSEAAAAAGAVGAGRTQRQSSGPAAAAGRGV